MKLLLLTLLSFALWAADPPKLPADAQKVVDAREASVAKAKKLYDDAVAKANAEAVKALGPVVVKLTKAGDLEGALSAKKLVGEWGVKEEYSRVDTKSDGIKVTVNGKVNFWDNVQAFKMDVNPHDLSFVLKFPENVSSFSLRAKPGYGCERFSFTIDNGNPSGLVREIEVKAKVQKSSFLIKGSHTGSNDEFLYGPLQYRIGDDEWADIPMNMINQDRR